MTTRWNQLNERIIECRRCSRLVRHCEKVAKLKRKSFQDDEYWGKPVANFGTSRAPLLIVGLAPAAHGANRTGRMFTGDRSGDWLFRALSRGGFANQAIATDRRDGLRLQKCSITAVCHCAPPDNRPTPSEIGNCREYLEETIAICRPKVFLALGGLAWKSIVRFAIGNAWLPRPQPKFTHAAEVELKTGSQTKWLIGSYHPSQQNTFTGRLTEAMLDHVINLAREKIEG